MNNDDLINNVLREYGYEGLINDDSTTSIQQVDGGTITAQRPLVDTSANLLVDSTETIDAIEIEEHTDSPEIPEFEEETQEEDPNATLRQALDTLITEAPSVPDNSPQIFQIEDIQSNDGDLLPVNHTSIEIDEKTLRFSGADWYHKMQEQVIVLAGLGGIGSWTALLLSRMQPNQIIMYDDDVIDRTNLAGQLYSQNLVGRHKVDGIASLMKDFSDFNSIVSIPRRIGVDDNELIAPIMVCGFDNMNARKAFFRNWCKYIIDNPDNRSKCLFVDGRLNMEEFQIFCIQGDDDYHIDKYATEALFNDEDAESDVCSMKQTTYCSSMIGSFIANLVVNFITNIALGEDVPVRVVPYFTYYSAGMMYLKMQM